MFDVINKNKVNFIDYHGWDIQQSSTNAITQQRRFNYLVQASTIKDKRQRQKLFVRDLSQGNKQQEQEQSRRKHNNRLPNLGPGGLFSIPIKTLYLDPENKKKKKMVDKTLQDTAIKKRIRSYHKKLDNSYTFNKNVQLQQPNVQKNKSPQKACMIPMLSFFNGTTNRYTQQRKQRIDNGTRRLYFSLKNKQQIDSMTTKYIDHFLKERESFHMRKGQKMFQIPAPEQIDY